MLSFSFPRNRHQNTVSHKKFSGMPGKTGFPPIAAIRSKTTSTRCLGIPTQKSFAKVRFSESGMDGYIRFGLAPVIAHLGSYVISLQICCRTTARQLRAQPTDAAAFAKDHIGTKAAIAAFSRTYLGRVSSRRQTLCELHPPSPRKPLCRRSGHTQQQASVRATAENRFQRRGTPFQASACPRSIHR